MYTKIPINGRTVLEKVSSLASFASADRATGESPETPSSASYAARDLVRPRVGVIYNPVAGFLQRRRLNRFLKLLRERGHDIVLRKTGNPGDATRLARELAADRESPIDVIVAAGGDGTINEVANGLIGALVPMAIVPLGTANVLAWELGHGLSISGAARLVEDGTAVSIRPAIANGRSFMLMASAGLDARTVAGVDKRLKRLVGKTAYGIAALRQIAAPPGPPCRLTVDGRREEAALVVVTKASHYAGPFIIAPGTKLSDINLTVILVRDGSRWAAFRAGCALLFGRVADLPYVDCLRARSVILEGPNGEPVQSDGDIIGTVPLEIHVGERDVRLIVGDPTRVRDSGLEDAG